MNLWPVYRLATSAAAPIAAAILARRASVGKEESAHLGERWGISLVERPPGPVIWAHAASVGESASLLPLLTRILARRPDIHAVVTTGTVTSAELIRKRLPAGRAWHQYAPIDLPKAIGRFLAHWAPDLAIWVESELWPNLVLETGRSGVRMALLNARISHGSWRRWRRVPVLARHLLANFDLVLAQDPVQAGRLAELGGITVDSVGDLKGAIEPAAPDRDLMAGLEAAVSDRPVWLAASTHPGEELVVAEAHAMLRASHPRLLTIIAPRHPARAGEISRALLARGLTLARRSAGEIPQAGTDVWLIDTLGEMGAFYALTGLVLVAGSLGRQGSVGGHNPIEPAAYGCALLHGPDMVNAAASAAKLDAAGATSLVSDARSLAAELDQLFLNPARLHGMQSAALEVAARERGVLDAVLARLEPLLPPPSARACA